MNSLSTSVKQALIYLTGTPGDSSFGSSSTAEDVTNGLDLTGRVVIITGGSSGIGLETARVLALRGAHVVIGVRDRAKGRREQQKILQEQPWATVDVMELDLSSLASVRAFADAFKQTGLRLHMLINNAGIAMGPFRLSKDGHELQLATNHLGHFLLVKLLLDMIKDSAREAKRESRIVILSSDAHGMSYKEGIRLRTFDSPEGYSQVAAYGQSKLANLLHARQLARNLRDEGIYDVTVNAVHPGVVNTKLGDLDSASRAAVTVAFFAVGFATKNVKQGAATTCFVAAHPAVAGLSGMYWADCNLVPARTKAANDIVLAKRLWDISEEIVSPFAYDSPPPSLSGSMALDDPLLNTDNLSLSNVDSSPSPNDGHSPFPNDDPDGVSPFSFAPAGGAGAGAGVGAGGEGLRKAASLDIPDDPFRLVPAGASPVAPFTQGGPGAPEDAFSVVGSPTPQTKASPGGLSLSIGKPGGGRDTQMDEVTSPLHPLAAHTPLPIAAAATAAAAATTLSAVAAVRLNKGKGVDPNENGIALLSPTSPFFDPPVVDDPASPASPPPVLDLTGPPALPAAPPLRAPSLDSPVGSLVMSPKTPLNDGTFDMEAPSLSFAPEAAVGAAVEAPVEAAVEAPVGAPVEAAVEAPVGAPVEAAVEAAVEAPVEAPVAASVEEVAPVEAPVEAAVAALVEEAAPVETPVEAPVEAVEAAVGAPVEVPEEAAVVDAPEEAAVEAALEAPLEAPLEAAVVEAPVEAAVGAPVGAPVEAPLVEAPLEAPVEAAVETPMEAPVAASVEEVAPVEAAVEASEVAPAAPVEAPAAAAVEALEVAPVAVARVEAPVEAPAAATIETLVAAPVEAPVEAPVVAPVEVAPMEAPLEASVEAPVEAPAAPVETLVTAAVEAPVEAPAAPAEALLTPTASLPPIDSPTPEATPPSPPTNTTPPPTASDTAALPPSSPPTPSPTPSPLSLDAAPAPLPAAPMPETDPVPLPPSSPDTLSAPLSPSPPPSVAPEASDAAPAPPAASATPSEAATDAPTPPADASPSIQERDVDLASLVASPPAPLADAADSVKPTMETNSTLESGAPLMALLADLAEATSTPVPPTASLEAALLAPDPVGTTTPSPEAPITPPAAAPAPAAPAPEPVPSPPTTLPEFDLFSASAGDGGAPMDSPGSPPGTPPAAPDTPPAAPDTPPAAPDTPPAAVTDFLTGSDDPASWPPSPSAASAAEFPPRSLSRVEYEPSAPMLPATEDDVDTFFSTAADESPPTPPPAAGPASLSDPATGVDSGLEGLVDPTPPVAEAISAAVSPSLTTPVHVET